jgi:hypothetical protein
MRGRAVTVRSFQRHVRRAEATSDQLLAGRLGEAEGWAGTLCLDRPAARSGLRIEPVERAS